jgi:hypothetical protein
MSLSDFLNAQPSLEVETVTIIVPDIPSDTETVITPNTSVVFPISLNVLPNVEVGGSENDLLNGKSGGSKVSFPISLEDVKIPITSIGSSEEDLTAKILVPQKY